ncbi:MAG: Lrp/AsnC family transcriptional regulator [Promethearchaeota archaeon]
MNSELLEMDDIDKNIMRIIQEDPKLTHTEIAKKVKRSQPTIGMRIKKLEHSGVLRFQAGVNLKAVDLIFARVDIQTLKVQEVLNKVKKCIYMINAFILSGTYNISILVVSPTLDFLDKLINFHFRKDPDIDDVQIEIVFNTVNDLILPINFTYERCDFSSEKCSSCLQREK